MSPFAITMICVGALVLTMVILFFIYNNKEIALRKECEAQRGKIKAARDRMFKVIREKAEVSTQYRDTFEKVFPEIISGRYGKDGGGDLMKWIVESNPNFDTSLYHKVMNAVEVQRQMFMSEQTRMLDIINQRATLIEAYPSRWFVRNRKPINYTVIASTKTNDVIFTGIDDEVLKF